jgi:hypothetical protein
MEEKIKLKNIEAIEELHKEIGSPIFKLQSETLKEIGNAQMDMFLRSLGFATTVISVIGIFAGFGFTAFAYIQSKFLFFIGEGLLFTALIMGLTWVQRTYQSEYSSLNQTRKMIKGHFDKRNDKYKSVFNRALNDREIDLKDLRELKAIDEETPDLFKNSMDDVAKRVYSKSVYCIAITGVITLFSSFFVNNLVHFVYRILFNF